MQIENITTGSEKKTLEKAQRGQWETRISNYIICIVFVIVVHPVE